MASPLFDPERGIWPWLCRLVDLLSLSLLWAFCSLPVVTLGAATAALYDAAARGIRGGDRSPWKRFLRTFRRELGVSAVVTVLWGAVLAALLAILQLLWRMQAADAKGEAVLLVAFCVASLLPLGAMCWSFPLLSRFTFRPMGLVTASLRFAIGYLPYTLAVVVVAALAAVSIWMLWLPVMVMPCAAALFWSLPMERAFRKYMPETAPKEGDSLEGS